MRIKILFITVAALLLSNIITGQTLPDYRKLHYLSEEEMNTPFNPLRNFTPTDPPEGEIRNVAEFNQMQGVIVRYPFGIPIELVREMAEYIMVTTIVANSSQQESVITTYENNDVNLSNCNFLIAPSDSYWVRDYGPWFVFDGNNQPGIIDFPYNRPRPNDNNIPQKVSEFLGIDLYGMDLISTGGNYMCDGMGQAASTDLVWEENPTLTHSDVADYVFDYLNNSPYHVMEDPLGEYIKHIDCWGKFLSPNKVLIGQVPQSDSRYQDFEDAANYFASETSSYGKPYNVYRVFTPGTYPNTPYTNSLILNNKVFVPLTGSQWDDDAIATYEEIMPGYDIVGITYSGWENTDALHCRTKGMADLGMLYIHHIPTTGEVPFNQDIEITANITACSGENIYTDSVLVYYKINSGAYTSTVMELESGITFTGMIENIMPNDTVSYYIYAADESGRNASSPYIGEPDPFVFTNFMTEEISFNPDTVIFYTYDEMYLGIPLQIINLTSDDVIINSITEYGDNFFWNVEEMPEMPYTLSADNILTLNIICGIPVSSNGYLIDDELFVETTNGTYIEHIMIDSDLLSSSEDVTISNESVEVYPNPFSDKLNFIIKDIENNEVLIQIFDINGKKILDKVEYISSGTESIISINTTTTNMKSGTYFYSIDAGNFTKSGKIIKVD